MRASIAALALIRRHEGGVVRWLANWNEKWRAFNLVGGHKEADESFRECCEREVAEELGLVPDADFRVSAVPAARVEYVAESRSAGAPTRYVMELFDTALVSAAARATVDADPGCAWLGAAEIRARRTADGRAVSETIATVFALAKIHLLEEDASMTPYDPKKSLERTDRVVLPPSVVELTEALAAHNHDVWAAGRVGEGWSYAPVRDNEKKHNPLLVPYDQLPEGEKDFDRRAAIETLKAIVAAGFTITKGA